MNRQSVSQQCADPYWILIQGRMHDLEREAAQDRLVRLARAAGPGSATLTARGVLQGAWRGWTVVQYRIADPIRRALRPSRLRAAPLVAGSVAKAMRTEVD